MYGMFDREDVEKEYLYQQLKKIRDITEMCKALGVTPYMPPDMWHRDKLKFVVQCWIEARIHWQLKKRASI